METVWSRPLDIVPYPNTWLEFTAKESRTSDRSVKYWIQDLLEDRFDDAIEHIKNHFLVDAPISKYFGAATNENYVEDYLRHCRWQLPNKTSMVCFREGSNEIVGLNINSVSVENDPFWEEIAKAAQTDEYKEHLKIVGIMRQNVDTFKKYNVDKFMSYLCLSVAPAYRGLNIGERFLEASKPFCKKFDIHVAQAFFSSDYSNYIADKLQFQIDSQYGMEELSAIYPKIPFHQIDAKLFAIKSWDLRKLDA